jgi:hypothetical protein
VFLVSPTRKREDTLRDWSNCIRVFLVSPTRKREDTLRDWPNCISFRNCSFSEKRQCFGLSKCSDHGELGRSRKVSSRSRVGLTSAVSLGAGPVAQSILSLARRANKMLYHGEVGRSRKVSSRWRVGLTNAVSL